MAPAQTCWAAFAMLLWLLVKTNGIPFWGRCTTHVRTYFSGDWDIHWGYDLDFDPWPCFVAYVHRKLFEQTSLESSTPLCQWNRTPTVFNTFHSSLFGPWHLGIIIIFADAVGKQTIHKVCFSGIEIFTSFVLFSDGTQKACTSERSGSAGLAFRRPAW